MRGMQTRRVFEHFIRPVLKVFLTPRWLSTSTDVCIQLGSVR
jgi:hypothetical protein